MRIDGQHLRIGGRCAVGDRLQVGAEPEQPRPLDQERDEPAVVADRRVQDPSRTARDRAMPAAGVEQIDLVALVPGEDRRGLARQRQAFQGRVGQYRPGGRRARAAMAAGRSSRASSHPGLS